MKRTWVYGTLISLPLLVGFPRQLHAGWTVLKWIEKSAKHGPSTQAKPEDRTEFLPVLSFDRHKIDEQDWQAISHGLKEGDLIAYRLSPWETRKEIFLQARLNKIQYRLLKYGHIAMVVKDPADENKLRLLSSWSLTGPNVRDDISTLQDYSWDVYRLNQWDRVNKRRFYEFIDLVVQRAGAWYGYDFTGMFGLWNSNLQPSRPEQIGYDYTCSTVLVAAHYYAGLELDAYRRHGVADIVTPLQIINSKGRIVGTNKETSANPGLVSVLSGNNVAEEPDGEVPGDEG